MFRFRHYAQLRNMVQLHREPLIEHKISYTIRTILIKSVANKCISITNYLVPENEITKSCPITPRLVDFSIGLVIFVLNFPDGQVLFLG